MVFSQGAGALLQRRTDSSPPAEVHPDHRPPAAAPIILAAEGVAVQTNIGKAHYPQSGLPTERTKQTPNHELGAPSVLVPNHAVPVARLLPYEQSTSNSNGPMFAEGAHLCFVPSGVCPQWVHWEAQQQQQQQYQQHQQYQHHHHQHQCPLLPNAQQEQEQRRRQLVAMAACSPLHERKFDAARRDDMAAACALKRKFDAFVMCHYTPRHPSKLPTRRWVSLNQLYHLIRPHSPMDV